MLEDEVPQKRRSAFQKAVLRALLTPIWLTKQGNTERKQLWRPTFCKEQMRSRILLVIRKILDDSVHILRCGHEQV